MSGTIIFRENIVWLNATAPGYTHHRLFWELLKFFDDHPNVDIISWGTGGVEGGTTTPVAWLTWAAPVPWSNNSWFVVESQKASASLNGDGSRQWQARFQVANSAPFADCSGVAHGDEGTTGVLLVRFSPDGGWNGATRTFAGVTASENLRVSFDAAANKDLRMHITGDDDTVVVYCQLCSGVDYRKGRLLHIGETVRRNSNLPKPEVAISGHFRANDENSLYPSCSRMSGSAGAFYSYSAIPSDQSFCLNADGTACHGLAIGGHSNNVESFQKGTGTDRWTTEAEVLVPLVRQRQDPHNSIIGQLRLVWLLNNIVAEGSLTADGNIISVGYDPATNAGVGIPWPGAGTFPIF